MKPKILCTDDQTPEFTRQHLVPKQKYSRASVSNHSYQMFLPVCPFLPSFSFWQPLKKCISRSFLKNSLAAANLSKADNTNVHLCVTFFFGQEQCGLSEVF